MSNFNLNKVILGGRLTGDPELRQTPQGIAVTSFGLAVSRRYAAKGQERPTDFINCVAWRSTAEFVSKYFHKGSPICVVGSIQSRSWVDQQGNKRYAVDVVVDEANFVDSAADRRAEAVITQDEGIPFNPYDSGSSGTENNGKGTVYGPKDEETPGFRELTDDDDLPF